METNINNRVQFISYRSQLVTRAFSKYAIIAFTALGIVTLTQFFNSSALQLNDQTSMSSIDILEERRDSGVKVFAEPIEDVK